MDLHAPLVVRNISSESLGYVDEEGEPVIEPESGKPGLVDRAKAMAKDALGRGKKLIPRDHAVELKKILPLLRTAKNRWLAIEAEHAAACDTSKYEQHYQKCEEKFARTKSLDDEGAIILAGMLRKRANETAHAGMLAKHHGELDEKWMSEHPKIRDIIRTGMQLKLELAKAALTPERIKAEQKRLADLGDYEGVAEVKNKATAEVENWETQLEHLDTKMVVYQITIDAGNLRKHIDLLLKGFESVRGKYRHKDDGDIYDLVSVDEVTDDGLVEFNHAYKLESVTSGKSWSGSKENFEKIFSKRF
jgi:hypothetical protein